MLCNNYWLSCYTCYIKPTCTKLLHLVDPMEVGVVSLVLDGDPIALIETRTKEKPKEYWATTLEFHITMGITSNNNRVPYNWSRVEWDFGQVS